MKKSINLFFFLLCVVITSISQTPVITRPVRPLPPGVKLDNPGLITMNTPVIKYDPAAPVKYIFYDAVRMNEVRGGLPEQGDYITLAANIHWTEFTLVPQNDLAIERSVSGVQPIALKETAATDRRPTGVPPAQTIWKVSKSGNNFVLTYSGAFLATRPALPATGGYLGLQAGQVKIAGTAGAIAANWQLQIVSADGSNYLRLQNTADNKLLGYTYNAGARVRPTGEERRVVGGVTPVAMTPENCAAGGECDIKWLYKIYRPENIISSMFPSPVKAGTYSINITYDNKSMLAFGPVPVFGQSNPALTDMHWQFEPTSRGTYFIINKKSNKALGVNADNNKFLSAEINTRDFYATDHLQWIVKGPFEGKYSLVPLMDHLNPNTTNGMSCKNGMDVSLQQVAGGSYWQEFALDSVNGPLWGYVDMHTHPMSHLAFAGKNFHGAPDVGSLMIPGTIYRDAGFNVDIQIGDINTKKPDCNPDNVRVKSVDEALGNCNATHGGFGVDDNNCGDIVRNGFIGVMEQMTDGAQSAHGKNVNGYNKNPSMAFTSWPKWNDMTHQKMWVDWIEMAYKSGLRVMVALAHNNKVMAEIIASKDGTPKDDVSSGDLQVKEIIDFVKRHSSFMEVALTSADLYRIIKSNKLAVIPGIELDYMGNFPITLQDNATGRAMVDRELDRLYTNGVRYIFPIHLSDNAFGATAIYEDLMNVMQKLGTNTFWDIECSSPRDSISHKYETAIDSRIRDGLRNGLPIAPILLEVINQLLPLPPGIKEAATPILSGIIATAGIAANTVGQAALNTIPDNPPDCGRLGHRNAKGLSLIGQYAVKRMMQKGMMIDIDHMSEYGVHKTLEMAMSFNYPVNSGHTGVRDPSASENQRTYRMLDTLTRLGGMFGIGWSGQHSEDWVKNYRKGLKGMKNRGVCFGSDINSIVFTPKPRPGSAVRYSEGFPAPASFGHTWNYNTDGMAHYGLLRDFVRDVRNMGNARELNVLFSSAQEFFLMWQKCEVNKRNVR